MDLDETSTECEESEVEYFESRDISNALIFNEKEKRLKLFRTLLSYPPEEVKKNRCNLLLVTLLKCITNRQIDEKRLTSQVFFTIFLAPDYSDVQKSYLEKMLNLDSPKLCIFDGEIDIPEVESFKLIIIHGYLLVSKETSVSFDIFTLSFEIIRKYCMTYTPHTYFSFKLLEIWLKKSIDYKFWNDNDIEFEKKLEAIIFSNWDNCINEIAKINALHLFSLYLEIMRDKYTGFLEYVLKTTVEHISWQNPTKYVIIAEIYKIACDYPKIPNLEFNMFQSVNKSHLRHVGTKLYITLIEKLNDEQWNELIRDHLYTNAKQLESEDNAGALYVLWELWMKPTIIKFKETIVPSLWFQFCRDGTMKSASYLAKISGEVGVTWAQLNSQSKKNRNDDHIAALEKYWSVCLNTLTPCIIDAAEDYVKLNAFIAYCHMKDFPKKQDDDYNLCKRLLYYNAKNCSTQFRKGLFDNFEILFERIIKNQREGDMSFVSWLQYFIFDCFEPGSCYQRKIIGLKLYGIILMYTNEPKNLGRNRGRQFYHDGIVLRKNMEEKNKWDMNSKHSLFILLKLCLDPVDEIRAHSFNIIENYFNINDLTMKEIETLMLKATEMEKSSKFYEIAGGVKLIRIVNDHAGSSFGTSFGEAAFHGAQKSLALIKKDILSALLEGSDFNASLTQLLELEFPEAFKNSNQGFIDRLLTLMEDATTFFLSALSLEDSDVSYSSSFAEMGITLEAIIKTSAVTYEYNENEISPAHQVILSCIWMALKTSCDLAAKITTMTNCHGIVKRSVDLIVSVLMKCRHKGAIEAAGVALGVSVHYLADKQEYHSLIDTYLDKLLSLNSEDKIDLTRRGAGLSIMFHRMMSNDDKKTRRLLHMAMGRLLGSLRDPGMKSDVGTDSNHDSACARQLHFLRTIVADKTLHSSLVAYLEEISLICFEHLQSREWAIRNGSLQLLGALIPRLVGQTPESDLDFGNGYSVNHFLTHYPNLAKFILEKVDHPNAFNIDSNMVAIVTLISKMSVGGCDFTDYSSQEYTAKLRKAVRSLFGHSVDHVRYAAAKAYAALVPTREIPQELLNMKLEKIGKKSRNYIHGHLMAQVCLQLSADCAGVWLKTFPNNERNMALLMRGAVSQLQRLRSIVDYCINRLNCISQNKVDNHIEATFLQSFRMARVWCKADKAAFREVISFTQFFDAAYAVSARWSNIGCAEFIEQLLKLDPSLNWELALDHILNAHYKHPSRYGQFDCCRYFSMKYLRQHVREQYLKNEDPSEGLAKLFNFLSRYVTIPVPHDRAVIEICKIIVLIIGYEGFSVPQFDESTVMKNVWYDPQQILDMIAIIYKNSEMQHLVLEIRLLIKRKLQILTPNDIINNIRPAIDNGDEQKRTRLLDTIMPMTGWGGQVLPSSISILSDESNEVRTALYEKLRENQWSNYLYHLPLLFYVPPSCTRCRHARYEHMKSLITNNLELCLHNAIRKLVVSNKPLSLRDKYKWLPHIVKNNTSKKNVLESPFDQDETYREITKTFNIYFEFQKKGVQAPSEEIDNIIMRSDYFFKKYVRHRPQEGCTDLHAILQYETSDYLQYKAEFYEGSYFPDFEKVDDVSE